VSAPVSGVLTQVGQTAESGSSGQPIFRFDPGFKSADPQDPLSYYQLQLAVRYGL
jgi:hypothetical protein